MQISAISSAVNPNFVRDPNKGLLPLEQILWQRIPSPVFQKNPDSGAWDHETSYYPVIARNLDRSAHRNASNKLMLYYTGDNNASEDLDEGGLALGGDVDTWTRYGSSPVLTLGGVGDPDAGDAQITSVFWDGSEFVVYYQGNATPPGDTSGDDVTVCLATSADGVTMIKHGRVISKGSGSEGDANDIYRPKLIPSGHDGLPKLYYTGQQASSGPFGLMGASSPSGSLKGPWTKITSSHLLGNPFGDSLFFLEDAWYADGLYHFLYMIGGSSPGGLWYATSEDGLNVEVRRQLVRRRAGSWDAAVARGSYYNIEGVDYIFFDASGSSGIGYVSG